MSSGTFSSKDLALLLPDEVGDSFTMQHTVDKTSLQPEDVVNFQPKIDTSKKVVRLRAGKAPVNANALSEYDANTYEEEENWGFVGRTIEAPHEEASTGGRGRKSRWDAEESNQVQSRQDDREEQIQEEEEVASSHRRKVQAAVLLDEDEEEEYVDGDVTVNKPRVIEKQEEEEEEEDEEEIAARRSRIRARLRQRREEEEEEEEEEDDEETGRSAPQLVSAGRYAKEEEEEVEEEAEDSSEYETDTDESDEEPSKLMKPVFVHKSKRVTITALEEKAIKDAEREKERLAKAEARKEETRKMVAEQIQREEIDAQSTANQNGNESDPANMPDDDDDEDDEVEFIAWKMRELGRMKRDEKLRKAFDFEKQETERRRNLTEAERLAEDRKLGKFDDKPKEKWNFMQKYYHKGAFYMDEDEFGKEGQGATGTTGDGETVKVDVRKRQYNEATLEDKFDKSAMPKVLQVKKFGFSGRTKYTHLKDQDTTDYGSAWMQEDVGKRKQFNQKLSGMGDIDRAGRKRTK